MQRSDNNQPNPCSLDTEESQIRLSLLYSTQRYRHTPRRKTAILQSYSYEELRDCCLPSTTMARRTLIGQYRFPLDRFTWEVTRGGGSASTAHRLSKAGTKGRDRLPCRSLAGTLCRFRFPWDDRSIAPGFVAWGLHRGEPHPDPEELITQRRVPFSAAVAMAISGEIAISRVSPRYCRLKRGSGGANFHPISRASWLPVNDIARPIRP